MTHRLSTNYAKNYCNRALIVEVIVENVVTCFLLLHSVFVLVVLTLILFNHPWLTLSMSLIIVLD